MDEQPGDSTKMCESGEDIGDLGIENLFSELEILNADTPLEVQSHNCFSESNSRSTPTKNNESNNDGGICTKDDEQLPITRSADLQPLVTDEDKIMEEVTAVDEDIGMQKVETAIKTEHNNTEATACSTVEWSHSARRAGRNYRPSSRNNSPEDNANTTAADGYDIHSQNTERQPLPIEEVSNGPFSNTENPSGVENFHVAWGPADNASENSMSSPESRFSRFPFHDGSDMIDDIELDNFVRKVLNKPKPSYTWNTTYELMRRETGLCRDGRRSLRSTVASGFDTRFYSSRLVVERMKVSECLIKHISCVNSLNFDRSGKLLCSGSDDIRIIVWNWAQRKPIMVFDSGHTDYIGQAKFIHSSGHLDIVSGSQDGQVRRSIITSDGAEPETTLLYRHNGPVCQIVMSPCDPSNIFSAGEDGHIRCKDIRCNDPALSMCKVENPIRNRTVRLYSIAHHPSSPQICASGSDTIVRVFDKRNMKERVHEMCPLPLVDTPFTQVTSAVYNITGSEVLASYSDDHIYLFNNNEYKTGDYLHRYVGRCNLETIKGVNFFGPHSEFVVSGSDCGNIFFWDKNTEAIVNLLPGDPTDVVNCLEPHPMIPLLASSGLGHNIKIWTPCSQIYAPDLSNLETVVKQNLRRTALQNSSELQGRRFYSIMRQFINENVDFTYGNSSSDGDNDDIPTMGAIQCHTQ